MSQFVRSLNHGTVTVDVDKVFVIPVPDGRAAAADVCRNMGASDRGVVVDFDVARVDVQSRRRRQMNTVGGIFVNADAGFVLAFGKQNIRPRFVVGNADGGGFFTGVITGVGQGEAAFVRIRDAVDVAVHGDFSVFADIQRMMSQFVRSLNHGTVAVDVDKVFVIPVSDGRAAAVRGGKTRTFDNDTVFVVFDRCGVFLFVGQHFKFEAAFCRVLRTV